MTAARWVTPDNPCRNCWWRPAEDGWPTCKPCFFKPQRWRVPCTCTTPDSPAQRPQSDEQPLSMVATPTPPPVEACRPSQGDTQEQPC